MKLIRLYIEQFGGLRQYELEFQAGLTVIQAENGFGKTTLAEFIRAMFYGFPRKTKTLGKRQKYLPWSGGKCAGNLEFEYEGVRYRIERTFGATPKSDTFKLVDADTNRPSGRFTENIGLELFGLDADSFERSTYLPQNSLTEALTTDSIRAKLTDLVEDTGDVGNFEKAAAALKAKRSSYALYRGVGGSVAEALGNISRVQQDLTRSQQAKEEWVRLREELERTEQERQAAGEALGQVRTQIAQASEATAVAAAQRQHRQLEKQLLDMGHALAEIQRQYPGGFPEEADLEQARRTHLRLTGLMEDAGEAGEETAVRRYLEENRSRFSSGVPSREALDAQRSRCSQYLARTAQAQSLGLPAEKEGELEETRLERKAVPAMKKNSWLPVLALILGTGLLALGIVLLVRGSYLPGGVSLGAGLLALILGAFLGIRGMISRELRRDADLSRQMEAQRFAQSRAATLLEEAAALKKDLEAFLGRYFEQPIPPDNWHQALDTLARDGAEYLRAQVRLGELEEKKNQRRQELARCQEALDGFFEKLKLTRATDTQAQLARLGQDALQLRTLQRQQHQIWQVLTDYREAHRRELEQPEVKEAPDLALLQERETALTRHLDALTEKLLAQKQREHPLWEAADQIPELQDRLLYWQEKKQADQKMADLLDDTLAFLQEAKDSLASSYLGPIRRGFDHYQSQLWDTEHGKVLIDPDLGIQLERQGQARELGYFSAGQADLVMLGMRLALVDALFGDAKPVVILDDPFVNLDDRRTAAALELLKKLSRDRQILYLVCNSSRSI